MEQLHEDLRKHSPLYGVEVTMKALRQGKVLRLYLASNCPHKEQFYSHAPKNCEILELPQTSTEVGVFCKKPFAVNVLSISA